MRTREALAFAQRADRRRAVAAGTGHAGPHHPHQARAHARHGRGRLCARLQDLFRRARAAGEGAQDHARSGAAHGPVRRIRPGRGRPQRERRGHRRRVVPAQHAGDAARAGPGRLPRPARARFVRGRILGPGAGETEKRRQAAAVCRGNRAGHRRGLGHRQGQCRGPARARRRGSRARCQSRGRDHVPAQGFPRPALRSHR